MDEIEQANHELDRLHGIITRHEGHMFALRGWLLTVVGGLLAAYYTDNVQMSETALRIALPLIAFLFLLVESRHVNLVEAAVERVTVIEDGMAKRHEPEGSKAWKYDGPRVSQACLRGATRLWPRGGMTFLLNLPFYLMVIAVILIATFSLPTKGKPAPEPATPERAGEGDLDTGQESERYSLPL